MTEFRFVIGERDFDDDEIYTCRCCVCEKEFLGYKRRVICKKCSELASADKGQTNG